LLVMYMKILSGTADLAFPPIALQYSFPKLIV
jgi:hypothetical protein